MIESVEPALPPTLKYTNLHSLHEFFKCFIFDTSKFAFLGCHCGKQKAVGRCLLTVDGESPSVISHLTTVISLL